MIERELTIKNPHLDAMDVQPRGPNSDCEEMIEAHRFFAKVEAAGFKYEICGRCGVVRITETHS